MICTKCGYNNPNNARHCGRCGNTLYANSNNKKKQSELIMVILIILIVVLSTTVIGVNIYKKNTAYKFSYGGGGGASIPSSTMATTPTKTEAVATEAPYVSPPVFTMASASSMRGSDSEGGHYSIDAVLSTNPMTKWVPQKSSSGGVNEWIEISANTLQHVNGIEILNGYHKSSEIWRNNNRVRLCTIAFSNGEMREFVLDDTMELIKLDLDDTIETYSIRLTIKSIYRGAKWNDTAITYLGAY